VKPRLLIALAGALLASGCDSTGPDDAFEITLMSTVSAPSTGLEPDSTLRIACNVTLRARATGSGADAAIWEDAELRWFVGTDRTQPLQVDAISQDEVRAFWQSDRLNVAELLIGDWELWADVPFTTEAEFRYRVNGSGPRRSADIALHCGLDPGSPLVASPIVTNVTVQAPTPFEPGDTLTVSYAASGAGRLFATAIVIEGAWQHIRRVPEHLAAQTQRSEKLVIPPGVILGMPLDIGVVAIDAFGQESAPVWVQSAPLTDVTPPHYFRATTDDLISSNGPQRLVGQYATVDTIGIWFYADDNHELGELIVDIGTERRTFPLDGHLASSLVTIPVEPAWAGDSRLAVSVTDAQGLIGPTIESHPDSLIFFLAGEKPRTSVSVPGRFADVAWDDARDRLFLTRDGESDLTVVSTATMVIERTIPLPAVAWSVDYSPGGDTAVVALPDRGTLAIIDLASGNVTEIDLAGGSWSVPRHVRVVEGGRAVVHAKNAAGASHLVEVDLATGAVGATVAVDGDLARFGRTRDRSVVTVMLPNNCLTLFHAASSTFEHCPLNTADGWISAGRSAGSLIVGGNVIDLASRTSRFVTWGMTLFPRTIAAVAADDTTAWVNTSESLTRVRIGDGHALERVPATWVDGILTSGDGRTLLTLRWEYDSIDFSTIAERLSLQ
jgi:hypothetical protein